MGRHFDIHPFFGSTEWTTLLRTFSFWFFQNPERGKLAFIILCSMVIFSCWWMGKVNRNLLDAAFLMITHIVIYIGIVIFSAAFFQADMFWDSTRIFLPVHVIFAILIVLLIHSFATHTPVKYLRQVTFGISIFVVSFFIHKAWIWGAMTKRDGQGYASVKYSQSPLLDRIKTLPQESIIYSNQDLPITLYTGINPNFIPVKVTNETQRENKNYQNEMKEMADTLTSENSFLVYFNQEETWYKLATLKEINEAVPLRRLYESSDGAIYVAKKRVK